MRFGMLSLADELTTASLVPPAAVPRSKDIQRHLGRAVHRFLYSMQQFNGTMQKVVEEHKRDGMGWESMPHLIGGECQADSLLNYLGIVVDDVAVVIALAMQFQGSRDDSMGGLKHAWLQDHAVQLTPVGSLLAELEQPGSWWHELFKPKAGMRQLVVHNQHLVEFQVSTLPDQEPTVEGFLQSPYGATGIKWQDFMAVIRRALLGLCEWLDRLEQTLRAHLVAGGDGRQLWGFTFPIGYAMGTTLLDPRYFLLPLCDGSDPLPWSIDVYQGESSKVLRPKRPSAP